MIPQNGNLIYECEKCLSSLLLASTLKALLSEFNSQGKHAEVRSGSYKANIIAV